jgi:adenylosuccinate synthase
MKHTYAIIDLQYGSTGKGLLAGYLAKREEPDGAVCAFGPNAGHTFIDRAGKKFVHVMMPMGALSPRIKTVFIGPGAIVHPELLMAEADHLHGLGYKFDLVIHENAAVVHERHREEESVYGAAIGSTQKGTGAALAEKIRRDLQPHKNIVAKDALMGTPLEGNVVTRAEYNDMMDKIDILQIEGAQGFSLSIHHGFYPFVTSRDCTISSLLSDCAVPRPRVNNKTGYSGPCYPDQEETSFEALRVPVELTTVTKLPRRVFTFSMQQIKEAVRMSAVDDIFLNFCNYMTPLGAESLAYDIKLQTKVQVRWMGWGPTELDIGEISS